MTAPGTAASQAARAPSSCQNPCLWLRRATVLAESSSASARGDSCRAASAAFRHDGSAATNQQTPGGDCRCVPKGRIFVNEVTIQTRQGADRQPDLAAGPGCRTWPPARLEPAPGTAAQARPRRADGHAWPSGAGRCGAARPAQRARASLAQAAAVSQPLYGRYSKWAVAGDGPGSISGLTPCNSMHQADRIIDSVAEPRWSGCPAVVPGEMHASTSTIPADIGRPVTVGRISHDRIVPRVTAMCQRARTQDDDPARVDLPASISCHAVIRNPRLGCAEQ